MATVHPFRGLRFNPEVVGDLTQVVTQPYDRIGADLMRAYLDRSPHNIVRITGSKRPPGDEADYRRRGELLQRWMAEGVLVRDSRPGIYAYHQQYEYEGTPFTRKGIVALLGLQAQGGGAKAHERTMKGPKEDRLKLLRATEANFGHIFMLYRDPARMATKATDEGISGCVPDAEARDDFGNRHLLWHIGDEKAVEQVQRAMTEITPYIADGHHRFETARAFMEECWGKGWRPVGPESFASRMVTLVNVAEPGCVVRPTPRVVHSLSSFSLEMFLTQAERDFEVALLSSLEEAKQFLRERASEHAFVAYSRGGYSGLVLRDEGSVDKLVPGQRSPEWKRLDVSILHGAILERILGIDEDKLARQTNVDYTEDSEGAIEAVDRGKGQVAFLLNPTPPEQVMAVADRGERMPQKSTDFYPKLLTGIVAMRMQIDKDKGAT
ncbi:MAG: DUF1015 domain-containing protein [Candidatus Bipolaricaulota bacterium]